MKKLIIATIVFISVAMSESKAQEYSVSTNIPALAFGNINTSVSFRLSDRFSLQIQGQVNPFDFKVPAPIGLIHINSKKLISRRSLNIGWVQHTYNATIQPGVRFWLNGVYNRGIFFGANVVASMYKLGGDKYDVTYRKGYAIGGALSVGYSYELSTFWNIEAEIGLGAFYNKYHNLYKEEKGKGFFNGSLSDVTIFPNRMALNVVYLF